MVPPLVPPPSPTHTRTRGSRELASTAGKLNLARLQRLLWEAKRVLRRAQHPRNGNSRVIFDPVRAKPGLFSREASPHRAGRVTFLSPPEFTRRIVPRRNVMLRGKRQKTGGNRRKHASVSR